MDRLPKSILVLVLSLLFFSVASAANFGSAAKNNRAVLQQGEDANFELLFWTSEEEAQIVVLSVSSAPEDWVIQFDQNFFNISSSQGNERILISGEYLFATSAGLTVDTANYENGTYKIVVSAQTSPVGEGISLGQERLFNLIVQIGDIPTVKEPEEEIGPREPAKTEEQNVSQDVLKESVPQNASEEKEPSRNTYIPETLAIIIAIIFISFLVYRFS